MNVKIKSVTVTEPSKAVVEFDDVIMNFSKDAFTFNNGSENLGSDKFEIEHDGSKLTFVIIDNTKYMPNDIDSVSVEVAGDGGAKIKSLNGFNGVNNDTQAAKDKIIPYIKPVSTENPAWTVEKTVDGGENPVKIPTHNYEFINE